MGGLLGGVRRVIDGVPCRARRADRPSPRREPRGAVDRPPDDEDGRPDTTGTSTLDEVDPWAVPEPEDRPATRPPSWRTRRCLQEIPFGGEGEMPPGPWRWRWVWPVPGRPSGMALVAADGTLVLWSPGGFATPGEPPDGRPTPDVATALANLPELSEAAAGADLLRSELERARAVAEETRRLLNRAAGTVDDEIGRVHGQDPDDDPPAAPSGPADGGPRRAGARPAARRAAVGRELAQQAGERAQQGLHRLEAALLAVEVAGDVEGHDHVVAGQAGHEGVPAGVAEGERLAACRGVSAHGQNCMVPAPRPASGSMADISAHASSLMPTWCTSSSSPARARSSTSLDDAGGGEPGLTGLRAPGARCGRGPSAAAANRPAAGRRPRR